MIIEIDIWLTESNITLCDEKGGKLKEFTGENRWADLANAITKKDKYYIKWKPIGYTHTHEIAKPFIQMLRKAKGKSDDQD